MGEAGGPAIVGRGGGALRWAATDPEGARAAMSRAIALREAMHRVLSAGIADEPPDEGAMSVLNCEISGALSRLRVAPVSGGAYGLGLGPGRERGQWLAAGSSLVACGALGGGTPDIPEARQGQGLRRGGVWLDVPGRKPQRQPPVVRLARLRQSGEGA